IVHAERVLAVLCENESLLGHHRADDHLARLHHDALATSSPIAASDTSSDAAPITSATPASATGMGEAPAMLRNDFPAAASLSERRTSVGAVPPQSDSRPAA